MKCNETFTGQKQRGHPSSISHPFCPRRGLSFHPAPLLITFLYLHTSCFSSIFLFPFSSFYPPIHPPVSFPLHLFCLILVFIFRDTNCFATSRETEDEKQEKIPAFLSLWLHLMQLRAALFFLPFSSSDLFSWTNYQPLWKCQTHFLQKITTKLHLWLSSSRSGGKSEGKLEEKNNPRKIPDLSFSDNQAI